MVTGVEAIAFEVTKVGIGALAKPVVTAALSGAKTLTSTAIDNFGNRLATYIAHQAERHSCMSTIVFGHQKSISELYIPLTVINADPTSNNKDAFKVDRFVNGFLPKNPRVLITDTAGMGKSTLSKFLFLQCLKSAWAVPFFIELRHLTAKRDIYATLLNQLNPHELADDEPRFSKRHLQKLLKSGSLLFFFDGYDEIGPADREEVTISLKSLIELYPQHSYVITSRPESGLLAFPRFRQFTIRPLEREESFALIRKYDEGSERNLSPGMTGRAEQLISKLSGPEFQSVHEFLKNPLLTSLLYRSFEYKQSVPLKKHVFYRQVFDALFDWHDATKDGYNTREKKSGLDIDSFHRMLRVVGFLSVMKGRVEGDTDTALGWIRQAKSVCNLPAVPESHFLEDLYRAVPVFVKDGDQYRWSHKSLAEYFAAQYLCTEGKKQQETVLRAWMSTRQIPRFLNVLDQIYDIDNAGFMEHLVVPVAKQFAQYWSQGSRGIDPAVPAAEVRLRRSVLFDRPSIIFPSLPTFETHEDFRKALSELLKGATGNELGPELVLVAFVRETVRQTELVVSVPGPHNTILSILESKKDPLVLGKARVRTLLQEIPKMTKSLGLSKATVITDDPHATYNQRQTFGAVTRILISTSAPIGFARNAPLADPEALLKFEATFSHSVLLESMTDELLESLTNAQKP